jgi:hypothetical protein
MNTPPLRLPILSFVLAVSTLRLTAAVVGSQETAHSAVTPPSQTVPPTRAAEAEPPVPKYVSAPLIRVDVMMVSLSEDRALPLLSMLRDPQQVQAAQDKLFELIGKKEAILEGWPEVTVHSGQRAVSEAITEQRYPVEFEVPKRPGPAEDKPNEKLLVDAAQGAGAPTPTKFETRNTGATLEAEAVVSNDGKAVSLQLVPQLVRLESMRAFPAGTTKDGTKISVEQPIFSTAKTNTSISMREGERRLIYLGKSNEVRNRMDLFILGVKVSASPATSGKR